MKPFYILILIIFIANSAFGQITQGLWMAGGAGSLFAYNGKYRSPNYNYESELTQIDISASIEVTSNQILILKL